jgi:hypothetical protein
LDLTGNCQFRRSDKGVRTWNRSGNEPFFVVDIIYLMGLNVKSFLYINVAAWDLFGVPLLFCSRLAWGETPASPPRLAPA